MIAFVGLGNVGPEYAATKHNLGFWVVDELVRRWNLVWRPGRGDYLFAEEAGLTRVVVAKPTSGMNHSGVAVREIREHWELAMSDLYVIVDDVDLPLGTMRIRPFGGDGCHRGMESIIRSLGTTQFPRVRMGIGTEEQMRPAELYVLKLFRKADEPLAREMTVSGADAVESILSVGLGKTMNRYNRTAVMRKGR